MNFPESLFDPVEEFLVTPVGATAGFADVEVVDLAIKNVLKTLSDLREVELLNDIELFQYFEVSVDARSVNSHEF